jgi:uncharacterized protein (UPF0297 family)
MEDYLGKWVEYAGKNWRDWTPIGTIEDNVELPFSGTFDGNGKAISGILIISNSDHHFQGLFGHVVNGVVKNVGVVNLDIAGYNQVGGVVGHLESGSVDNCYSTGSISGSTRVGGIVGEAIGSVVTNCYSSAKVWIYNRYGGGVVGAVSGGSRVNNCYSTGEVGNYRPDYNIHGGEWPSQFPSQVGGVVGIIGDGTVANCYSTGTVRGAESIGGVVGYVVKGSVTNCVALNPEIFAGGYRPPRGRVVGNETADDSEPKQSAETGYILADNFAFANMTGNFPDITGATTVNGADITIEDILSDSGALDKMFNAENGWTKEKGKLPGLRGEAVDIPGHLYKTDGVASHNREIPVGSVTDEASVAVAPLNKIAAEFTAGPNPAGKPFGGVSFYFSGKRINGGKLAVYDAFGNVVSNLKIEDRESARSIGGKRQIGAWDFKDKKGRPVPKGTYLIRGTVTTADKKREKVAAAVGVR